MNRRKDPPMAAGMAFTFSVAACAWCALVGIAADHILMIGMITVVPAGLLLLRSMIEQSELRTRERLVEMQYELARLAERLDDDGAGGAVRR